MKFKFHTCCIEMHLKKSTAFGFTTPMNVKQLPIFSIGELCEFLIASP